MSFAAIFDLDGVIMDTTEFIAGSIEAYLKGAGIKIKPIIRKDVLGIPLSKIIENIEKHNRVKIDYDDAVEKTRKMQLDLISKHGKPTHGLTEFLDELKNNNVPMIIGTSSGYSRARAILEFAGVTDFFSADRGKKRCYKPQAFSRCIPESRGKAEHRIAPLCRLRGCAIRYRSR